MSRAGLLVAAQHFLDDLESHFTAVLTRAQVHGEDSAAITELLGGLLTLFATRRAPLAGLRPRRPPAQ